MIRKNPSGASFATASTGARLFAPAADRNSAAITALIAQIAPETGNALEIASGTGQHVVAFAKARPALSWQPTDVAENRLASIDAYAEESPGSISPARHLDATRAGWSAQFAPLDFVFLANLLHLISAQEAKCLITETALALKPKGKFLIYGPFKRDGQLTSPGDQSFHDGLISQDPDIGYKDLAEVIAWAAESHLAHVKTHAMPANNLALEFVFTR